MNNADAHLAIIKGFNMENTQGKKTITDIALESGVAISTVSKVIRNYSGISEETRQKVMDAMVKVGYVRSSVTNAPKNKLKLIAVIYSGINVPLHHPHLGQVINSLKEHIGLFGYDLVFLAQNAHPNHELNSYLQRCRKLQVEGCLITVDHMIDPRIAELIESDLPCVAIDMLLKGNKKGSILINNMEITSKIVEHLYLNGYRDIGYIGVNHLLEISTQREVGLKNKLRDYGLTVNEQWFMPTTGFSEQSGYDSMMELLNQDQLPEGMFVFNDIMAIGVLRACAEKGIKVPEQMAVVGCDDLERAKYLQPPLTTVRQDRDKIGVIAATVLMDLIAGNIETSCIIVDPELIERESVKKLTKIEVR
jgi:LacI family transcriptional regulator